MYVLEAGTIAGEDNIFEEAEKTIARNERFLRWVGVFARATAGEDVSVVALSLSKASLPTDRGVHIQFSEGKWVDVFAQEDTFSIRRSCGFHLAIPWHPGVDPNTHVRKAIRGFLRT